MAQNIYDRPTFFERYSRLPRAVFGLEGAPEWPAVRALLPPLDNRRVVDLGCGAGAFARWAREQGAAAVLGLDLSQNMLSRARANTVGGGIRYVRADLEMLELTPGAFDLAYSALALHYVQDLDQLLRTVFAALVPGGHLVFTVEHPIYMAAMQPDWVLRDGRQRSWPVDHYAIEGERRTDWLAAGVIKHHRQLATTLNGVLDAGFVLRRVLEWSPTPEQLQQQPALIDELERPMLLAVAAQRP